MKTKLNVVGAGLAASLCLSLITACSDGRGMGGFKSYRSTPEQRAEWLAKNQPPVEDGNQNPADQNGNTIPEGTINPEDVANGQTPGTETNGEKPADQAAVDTNRPGTETVQPPAPEQEVVGEFVNEEAKSQVLSELGQQVAEDPAQQRPAKVADLIVANDAALATEDAAAKALVKGISLYVEGDRTQRLLSLDAVVQIGSDIRSMHVAQAPLKVTSDGQTVTMPVVLKSVDTMEQVQAGDKVYVLGNCKDSTCNDIQVRIEFTGADGSKPVAAFLIQLTGDGYKVTHSNIGSPSDFETALASNGGKAPDATAQTEQSADTTVNGEQPAAADTTVTEKPADTATTGEQPADAATTEEGKPAVDVGGVEDIVQGDNSVTVDKADGPGVGVIDDRAQAIAENRRVQEEAAAIAAQRKAAEGLQAIHDRREQAVMDAQGTAAAKPAAVTRPPVAADARAEAIAENRKAVAEARALALQRRAEAQRRAGTYPGARAATVKKKSAIEEQREEQLAQRRRVRTTAQ